MTTPDNTTPTAIPVENGAEAFLELLNANGVKYIFINPGSDILPILEAASKFKHLGKTSPELVLCQHESLAMTTAQGYFMASGKPQVVLVHLDLGTLQVGGALHNAQRGNAGIVLCAGRPPWTFEGELPGGRSILVDFRTEQFDQAAPVRQYVKWDYDLRCNENIQHVVQRAFQVASTEPCGPVYLTFARELLMQKMTSVRPLPQAQYGPARTPQADPAALEEAARLLANACNPLFITGQVGRHTEAVAPFIKLAEAVAARVVAPGTRMNFPNTHPLWGESSANPYLKDADVILLVDSTVPYAPIQARPSPSAKIICIDIDPIKADMPTYSFPANIRIQADSSKAIPALLDAVTGLMDKNLRARAQERLDNLKEADLVRREKWRRSAESKAGQRPISGEWLAYCLGREIDEKTVMVHEAISYWNDTGHHVVRSVPGTEFRADGSSLGWGLGGALGVKLALKNSTVVCLTGDGCFLYGYPTHALWAAANYGAPFLNIVCNNGGYATMDRIVDNTYGPNSFSSKLPKRLATSFLPCPDYAMIAHASGAWAEKVEDPARIPAAIKEGLKHIHEGQPAVLDVVLARA
ncbi:MAG: thiamine pyrophosphate-requiring protein [Chloroflexota bacterium]